MKVGNFFHPGALTRLFRLGRSLFPLAAFFLTSSCLPFGQGSQLAPLPEISILPPAAYTQSAPEYTMFFQTVNSSLGGAAGLLGGGESVIVNTRVISHPGPADNSAPVAYHMIPAGLRMDKYLPLLSSPRSNAAAGGSGQTSGQAERYIVKVYWGCGEKARQGQPKVFDTRKLSGKGLEGYLPAGEDAPAPTGGGSALKAGWAEALWPNQGDSRQVPAGASLLGEHMLHGNFLPHMRFTMDERHDVMGALTVTAENTTLTEAVPITWNKLPTAIGYQVTAVAFNQAKNETIIWSSSENPNTNMSGQFLGSAQVKKYISSKAILPADRTRCVIPKGIFAGADMVMVTVTAWGDDYVASEPTRPAKAPKNWKPDWVVKGQFISTGTYMLGMPAGSLGFPGLRTAQ